MTIVQELRPFWSRLASKASNVFIGRDDLWGLERLV